MIHKTAVIGKNASIGENVKIGPYCVVGDNVTIGDGTILECHVAVDGRTTIGKNVRISPFASIGQPPQDLKFKGEDTEVMIGDGTVIREYVTVNLATNAAKVTRIGKNNFIMAYCHVAHDCTIGDNCILSNGTALAGHVTLDNYVTLCGSCGVQQFMRVGSYAYIGGFSAIDRNVPPYCTGYGNRLQIKGINVVGLRRKGFSDAAIKEIHGAWKIFYKSGASREEAVAQIAHKYSDNKDVLLFSDFIDSIEGAIAK